MKVPLFVYHNIVNFRYITKEYILRNLKAYFDIKNKKTLDFGCGTGAYCFIFDPSNYIGVDIDKKKINYARKLYPNYSFSLIENGKIPLPNSSFELIFINNVLHHISNKNILRYIKEFYRLLKPYGEIIVLDCCLFPNTKFNNWFMKLVDEGKHFHYEKDYLDLFKKKFKTKVHNKYKTIYFYNTIVFSAIKM